MNADQREPPSAETTDTATGAGATPPPVDTPDISLPPDMPPRGPWGLWATIGWTLLIAVCWLIAQIGVVVIYVVWKVATGGNHVPSAQEIQSSGLVLALSTIANSPVAIGMTILFAWLRRGYPIRDYLAWNWPEIKVVIWWGLGFLVLIVLSDTTTTLLGKPIVPDVMVDAYRNAAPIWTLWLALMVAAPFSEEIIFRGFLFAGLRASRLGGVGTVIVTAVAWSILHIQYDAYGVGMIFLSGLFVGYMRLKTGSLPLCIAIHSLSNLVATAETAFIVGHGK